jgi:lipopolysaccharide/colanic/teichoic acid biosynthesis glycosyltransferase
MATENKNIQKNNISVEVLVVNPPGKASDFLAEKKIFLRFKRQFDLLFSTGCLILSAPLWFVFPLLIWAEDRGPVFYRQERIGKNKKKFSLLKFRSMIPNAEVAAGAVMAASQDPRITKVGYLLRKSALDELPQLLSIWKGDMSFVGPRALRESEKIIGEKGEVLVNMSDIKGFAIRQSVSPGLTGMAQVYAARDLHHRYKFKYDLLYIKKMSLGVDLKLILTSFWFTFTAKWQV